MKNFIIGHTDSGKLEVVSIEMEGIILRKFGCYEMYTYFITKPGDDFFVQDLRENHFGANRIKKYCE